MMPATLGRRAPGPNGALPRAGVGRGFTVPLFLDGDDRFIFGSRPALPGLTLSIKSI